VLEKSQTNPNKVLIQFRLMILTDLMTDWILEPTFGEKYVSNYA
jgi:hypothetical protein